MSRIPSTPRHQRATGLEKFLFGVPYYPEHWTPKDRRDDAKRMADAGVNTVRMAEFAWNLMEPSRGKFDFALFDETIRLLAAENIQTILCTPTAAPPLWITQAHPDWMRIDASGRAMTHGSRQHCCTNNPGFQKESVRITRAMARHFRANPHVIGWQTDNEFFCHFSECHCSACLASFRAWLRKKYQHIDALNESWGTVFWAQTYRRFGEVSFPYPDRPTHANPGQQLDYYRFLSHGICAFQSGQAGELRRANAKWWISHNGVFPHIDHWALARGLDFYGVDVYPGFSAKPENQYQADPVWAALKHEECRAASGNFVVFEQQGGAGGQRPYLHPTPRPGQMRLWAWQAAAHGADGVLHFRWRTCRFGAEIYWNGILDHDNIPRRRYREFSAEGKEFRSIGPKLIGTVPVIRAAVLFQNDQDEAHQTMSLGLPSPSDQREHLLRELQKRHLPCGLVDASDSFAGLKVIFLPGFVLMDADLASRLHAFVQQGGILVAGARTATRGRSNQVLPATPPGWLQETFGLTVEEFGAHDPLSLKKGQTSIPSDSGYEILRPVSKSATRILARWKPLPGLIPHSAAGTAAIVHHRLGRGGTLYIGTFFGSANSSSLAALALDQSRLKGLATAPPEVEMACRFNQKRSLLFLLNHSGRTQSVKGLPAGFDLIRGQKTSNRLSLSPYGVAVIETPKKDL